MLATSLKFYFYLKLTPKGNTKCLDTGNAAGGEYFSRSLNTGSVLCVYLMSDLISELLESKKEREREHFSLFYAHPFALESFHFAVPSRNFPNGLLSSFCFNRDCCEFKILGEKVVSNF